MKQTSILMVGNFLSSSLRTRSVCEDLSVHLISAGWQVITTSSKHGRISRLSDMILTAWRKRNQYEIAQVDVYSGNAFIWAESICWMLRRLGKPYILSLHGGNLPQFSKKWPNRVRWLLQSAAAVTCPSAYLMEELRKFRNDLILLPNPIDLKAFPFILRNTPQPKLVWLRAFHPVYNPELAPRVIAILKKIFPEIRLQMAGPVKDQASFINTKKVAEVHGVTDRIEFCGAIARENIGAFLNQSDIFLNTTFFDNTPVSILEAMACGLCIVSTDVGGLPYLLKHELNALLVPSNDAEEMAAAVERLLKESTLASTISNSARKLAEKFDWTQILPQWESLLTNVSNYRLPENSWKLRKVPVGK